MQVGQDPHVDAGLSLPSSRPCVKQGSVTCDKPVSYFVFLAHSFARGYYVPRSVKPPIGHVFLTGPE
jgi:hypothetical protein